MLAIWYAQDEIIYRLSVVEGVLAVIVVAYSAWNEIRSLLGPTQLFHFWLISDENEFQLKRQYV